VKNSLRQFQITACPFETNYQNQNQAQSCTQFVKSLVQTLMDSKGSPCFLWLLCTIHVCFVLNHMTHDQVQGLTPIQSAYSYTSDVSVILCFSWYHEILF
jgi:F0F1-type ATP synthase membrane subunit a